MSDLILIIIFACIISVVASAFGKNWLPKDTTYDDDKKELKRLQKQEKILKKIHNAEKK